MKVAQMYETGDELPKNSVEALKWYRKAADTGDPQAEVKVERLLLVSGPNPTEEEYPEARRRCEDAANRRSSLGAYCVASLYERGIGVTKDPTEGVKWLGRAAELGYAPAALNLGQAYGKGLGVKSDLVTAYMWIWLAANSKVPGAEQDQQELRKELPPKKVNQAKQKATEWLVKHPIVGLWQR